MSYMILMINKNGAVIAADTRYLKIPHDGSLFKKNDNGKKLVFSQILKLAISIVGSTSYTNKEQTVYLQSRLGEFIQGAETRSKYSKLNLSQLIMYFLYHARSYKFLMESDISNLKGTFFTGVRFDNGFFESIDVDVSTLIPYLDRKLTNHDLDALCKRKILAANEVVIITGGDHIFSWLNEFKSTAQNEFDECIAVYKKKIANFTLEQLSKLVYNSMDTIIAKYGHPSIGGNIDYVCIDNKGNFFFKIKNSLQGEEMEKTMEKEFAEEKNYIPDEISKKYYPDFYKPHAEAIKEVLSEVLLSEGKVEREPINLVLEYFATPTFKY
jgi:hypothetical protein